ncbi:MAG: hypothetical protein RLY66_436 [Candidatus Parcubacteria bacterium]|jgi:hypothetical protein
MKNPQKGFVTPLLLAIIAVLVVGGGVYLYSKNERSSAGPQAKSILENLQQEANSDYKIEAQPGFKNIPGYKLPVSSAQKIVANRILATIGEVTQPSRFGDRVEYAYENWHLLCMIIGPNSVSSDLPYVWCADKVGIQEIGVVVKDIKSIDIDARTFMLTTGMETMKVKMPTVVQNTRYQNDTFAEFIKVITNSQYQRYTFKMIGELKRDIFEVTSIQWTLG